MGPIYVNQNSTKNDNKDYPNEDTKAKTIRKHHQSTSNEVQTKQPQQNVHGQATPVPAPRLQVVATKLPQPGLKFNKQIGIDFFSFLDSVPSLLITQKVNLIEAITAVAGENKFAIIDPEGNCRLVASEKSGFCDRLLCGLHRSFRLQIRDTAGNLCLELESNIDCSLCCGLLFPDSLRVNLPNEIPIGTVNQRKNIKPSYSIKNSLGETKFILEGHWFPYHCPGHDVHYEFFEKQMEPDRKGKNLKKVYVQNGSLVKNWVGCGKEIFTEADDFIIHFPTNTSHKTKALCLASVFLINMRYFESKAWTPKIAIGVLGL